MEKVSHKLDVSTVIQGDNMEKLQDPAAEIAVLSAIVQHGKNAYLDVSDVISSDSFSIRTNQKMYAVLSHILATNLEAKIDYHLILSAAKDLDLASDITSDKRYIERIISFPSELSNARGFAQKIRKFQETKNLMGQLNDAALALNDISGNEPMSAIIAMAEEPIFGFINKLTLDGKSQIEQIGVGLEEYLQDKESNPVETIGIPTCFPIWQDMMGGLSEGVHVVTARPKVGKAQTLDSIIYTIDGTKLNRDIKIGDMVCTDNGSVSRVTHIHPQGLRPVYQITFKDGDSVECDEEHLWKVKSRRWQDYKILSLKDILQTKLKESDRYKWQVPLPSPAFFNSKKITIHPYILGLLLGDGSFRGTSIGFTTADKELIYYMDKYLENGYICKKKRTTKYGYIIQKNKIGGKNKYIQYIKDLGLSQKKSSDKFIPDIYMYNDIYTRMELLKGLLDTDGSIKKRHIEYSTKSKLLSEHVKFLVNSLGGICKIKKRKTRYTKKDGSKSNWFDSFRLSIYFNNNIIPFRLARKYNKMTSRSKPDLKRVIKSIEYVGKKECQCITIENPNGLYLTDNFVVTHNSTFAINVALHVAGKEKIPVLYLDTELNKTSGTWDRMLARIASVPFDDIRKGRYIDNEVMYGNVHKAKRLLQKIPLSYINITGKNFDEVISLVRRWIVQSVGYDNNGKIKPCLLVYDYLKLTGSAEKQDMKEYEAIGYRMSALHDLTVSYSLPCLTFCQLNREFDVSQSDRIRWFCTSMCSLQKKTEDEIAQDNRENGNRKLVPEDFRFGPGLDDGDYINMQLDGRFAKIEEKKTRNQLGLENANQNRLEPDEVDQDF